MCNVVLTPDCNSIAQHLCHVVAEAPLEKEKVNAPLTIQ